jgi:hypothetical protein
MDLHFPPIIIAGETLNAISLLEERPDYITRVFPRDSEIVRNIIFVSRFFRGIGPAEMDEGKVSDYRDWITGV